MHASSRTHYVRALIPASRPYCVFHHSCFEEASSSPALVAADIVLASLFPLSDATLSTWNGCERWIVAFEMRKQKMQGLYNTHASGHHDSSGIWL